MRSDFKFLSHLFSTFPFFQNNCFWEREWGGTHLLIWLNVTFGPCVGLIWNFGKPVLIELHSLDSTGQQGWRSQQTLPAVMHTIPDKQWCCRAIHFLTSLSIQGEFKPGLLYVDSVIPGLATLACPSVYCGIFCVPEFWSWEVNAFQGGVNLSNSLHLK